MMSNAIFPVNSKHRAAGASMADGRRIRATTGTNLGGANAHNRRVIVEALRLNGALSRADLARASQLTKQTVSNLVEDLEAQGLIRPMESVKAARGKPATPYELVPGGAYSLGLHIDRHAFRLVAVNLLGDVLIAREARPPGQGPELGLPTIHALIGAIRAELAALYPEFEQRLVGLGIAMPGPFGIEGAANDPLSMSSWQRYPLLTELTALTGLEIAIQNDAAAATAAERLSGAAHGVETAACIYLGYGLGAGLILNGELFTGPNGNAGELGMVLAPGLGLDGPAPVEHSASLASFCAALALDPADPEIFARIEAVFDGPDPTLRAWLASAGRQLRWIVHLLETLFDPETIILCGGVPRVLIEALIARTEPLLPSLAERPDRVLPRLM
ncbi:ROK family transcriptional regulator, partial [Thioclava sp. BHET1]